MKIYAQLFQPGFHEGSLGVGVLCTAANNDGTQLVGAIDSQMVLVPVLVTDTRASIRTKTVQRLRDEYGDQTADVIWWSEPAECPPEGPAGGVLSGTYPNPGLVGDIATQAELDAHAATPHGGGSIFHATADTAIGTADTDIAGLVDVPIVSGGVYSWDLDLVITTVGTLTNESLTLVGPTVSASHWNLKRWVTSTGNGGVDVSNSGLPTNAGTAWTHAAAAWLGVHAYGRFVATSATPLDVRMRRTGGTSATSRYGGRFSLTKIG